jgi:hypothetical protein
MIVGSRDGRRMRQYAINIIYRDPLYFEAILGGKNRRAIVVAHGTFCGSGRKPAAMIRKL